MWPPIYHGFESHSCLYTEYTVAREDKCMLNSCSVNALQGIQSTGTTSQRDKGAYIHMPIAGKPLQEIATGLYSSKVFRYSQKEFLAMYNPPLPSSMIYTYK